MQGVMRMGLDVVVEEVELAEPGDCPYKGYDVHVVTAIYMPSKANAYEGPGMAGHEIAGIVDKCGPKVTYVKPKPGSVY